MALFKRLWRLTIQVNSVLKTYQELENSDTSLKIEFDVEVAVNGTFSNGNITIHGLTTQDIAFLSTNFANGSIKPSLVVLEAGYKERFGVLLKGNIIEAEPNFLNPVPSIRLKVISGALNNTQRLEMNTSISKKATFKDLCALVAKNNQSVLNYDLALGNIVIGDFVFDCSPFAQIEKLRELNENALITLENGKLFVKSKHSKGFKKIKLDSSNGLIGIPKPTFTGCIARSYLNPSLNSNVFVELKNSKIPQINGLYRLGALKHKGSNRSDLWETELTLQKGF